MNGEIVSDSDGESVKDMVRKKASSNMAMCKKAGNKAYSRKEILAEKASKREPVRSLKNVLTLVM